MSCFTRTLRDVPAIQKVREQILDKAIERLSATAEAMTDLRRDVEWDPKDEETQLAIAGPGLPGTGHCEPVA